MCECVYYYYIHVPEITRAPCLCVWGCKALAGSARKTGIRIGRVYGIMRDKRYAFPACARAVQGGLLRAREQYAKGALLLVHVSGRSRRRAEEGSLQSGASLKMTLSHLEISSARCFFSPAAAALSPAPARPAGRCRCACGYTLLRTCGGLAARLTYGFCTRWTMSFFCERAKKNNEKLRMYGKIVSLHFLLIYI